jgi:hypothetical protein
MPQQAPFAQQARNLEQTPPLATFGGGRATAAAFQTGEQLAQKAMQITADEYRRANQVKINDGALRIIQLRSKVINEGRAKKGTNALTALDDGMRDLEEGTKAIMGEMTNVNQRMGLMRFARGAWNATSAALSAHQRTEFQRVDDITTSAILRTHHEDYSSIRHSAEKGAESVAEAKLQEGVTALKEKLDRQGIKNPKARSLAVMEYESAAIESRIRMHFSPETDDVVGARAIYEATKDRLDHNTKVELGALLHKYELEAVGKDVGSALIARHKTLAAAAEAAMNRSVTYIDANGEKVTKRLTSDEQKEVLAHIDRVGRLREIRKIELDTKAVELADKQWQQQGNRGWRNLVKWADGAGVVLPSSYVAQRKREDGYMAAQARSARSASASAHVARDIQKDELAFGAALSNQGEVRKQDRQVFINEFVSSRYKQAAGRLWDSLNKKTVSPAMQVMDFYANEIRASLPHLVPTKLTKAGRVVGVSNAADVYLNAVRGDMAHKVAGLVGPMSTEEQKADAIRTATQQISVEWTTDRAQLEDWLDAKAYCLHRFKNIGIPDDEDKIKPWYKDKYDKREGDRINALGSGSLSAAQTLLEAYLPGQSAPNIYEVIATAEALKDGNPQRANNIAYMIATGGWYTVE